MENNEQTTTNEEFDDAGGHHIIQDLSTVLDLLPSSVDAFILRASMYIRVGMFTPALHDLRNAAFLKQNDTPPHFF